ncbi:MAG: PIN domain-containing protein [Pseudomonadota bacterium]
MSGAGAPVRALLDANVLVPTVLRALLFEAASVGLFTPLWTDRIEAEWRAAALKGPDAPPEMLVDGDLTAARVRFPEARVAGWEAVEGDLRLPDWHDRHVLAGAVAGGAALLITSNLKDFPRRALAAHGIAPEAPDAFLWRLAGEQEAGVRRALEAFSAQLPPHLAEEPLPKLLKRARLPRFAKAVTAF